MSSHLILKLPPNYPYDDLVKIAELLKVRDVFVPGYIPGDGSLYEPSSFMLEGWGEKIETVMLPDRNVVSRIARVAQGEKIDAHMRMAAATMAFAQCLDILIEPSVSFHELAPSQGNSLTISELSWFRVADNGLNADWIAAALGRVDRIEPALPLQKIDHLDLSMPLSRWKRNYIAALKIAEIELGGGTALGRIKMLLDWMYHEFILAGPAALLGCIYFAPFNPPRQGLFKQLRSDDRDRAIRGVKNAAWDITHLSDFARRVNEHPDGDRRFLFVTFDASLRTLARLMIGTDDQAEPVDRLAGAMRQWWSAADASVIAHTLFGYFDRGRSPEWFAAQKANPHAIDEFIDRGECVLRRWKP
jgi:hypothetical protein